MTESSEFSPKPELVTGVYRHYKGNDYEVMDVVCHSETHQWLVLYRRLYEMVGPEIWVRPYDMFMEDVELDGERIPRFRRIDKN